ADRKVVRVRLEGSPPAAPAVDPAPQPASPSVLDTLDPAPIRSDERFNLQPKELVQVLGEHRGRPWLTQNCAAYSSDGKLAASGGHEGYHYVSARGRVH